MPIASLHILEHQRMRGYNFRKPATAFCGAIILVIERERKWRWYFQQRCPSMPFPHFTALSGTVHSGYIFFPRLESSKWFMGIDGHRCWKYQRHFRSRSMTRIIAPQNRDVPINRHRHRPESAIFWESASASASAKNGRFLADSSSEIHSNYCSGS